jgi:hypothetical protein
MASTPAPFIKILNNEIPTLSEQTQISDSVVNQPSESEPVILHSSTTTLLPVYKKATAIPKFFHTKPPKN